MRKAFYPVARVGEIPPGTGRLVQAGSEECVLFCPREGEYYASGDLCPHQNEPLDRGRLEGYEVICRRHHLCFDLRDGRCTNAYGYSLQTFDVRVEGDQVLVGVWEDNDS